MQYLNTKYHEKIFINYFSMISISLFFILSLYKLLINFMFKSIDFILNV